MFFFQVLLILKRQTLTLSRTGQSRPRQDVCLPDLPLHDRLDPMGYNVVHGRQAGSGFKVVKCQVSRVSRTPSSCSASPANNIFVTYQKDDILTSSEYRTDAQLAWLIP